MRINTLLKPALRAASALEFGGSASAQPSLLRAAAADARVTLTAYPILLIFAVALAIASVTSRADAFMHGVLPAAFFLAGLAITDIPCRERRAGTLGLIHSAPLLKAGFVWWKCAGMTLVSLTVLAGPLARLAAAHPSSLLPVGVGLFLIVAGATSFGVISSTPKTFTIVFLTVLYIVTNDRGATSELDFAGFYGTATPLVTLAYAALASALLAGAVIVHAVRQTARKPTRRFIGLRAVCSPD